MRTLKQIESEGHKFKPNRWQRGSATAGCECGHDFGRVGGTLNNERERHRDHLRRVKADEEQSP